MDSRASSSLVFFSFFFLLSSSASAFNITKLLDHFSDFSTLNNLLTQTQLASQINSRQTITVLAVDNGAIGAISGMSLDVQKRILSDHVILDYYDADKLKDLSKNFTRLTTLFQTTGQATGQLGFLGVSSKSDGIYFGSAVSGSQMNSKLVKSVSAQPYNISVLQISSLIVADGIENSVAPQRAPPAHSPSETPSHKKAEEPSVPDSSVPESSPPGPSADAPGADSPADEAKPPVSSAARVGLGSAVVFCLLSALMA